MLQNLKSFFRSLGRNRIHTIITIIGFSLSMAVVILLSAYIKSEKNINCQYPKADRTYLMVLDNQSASLPESLLGKIKNQIPGIEDTTMWMKSELEIDGMRIKATTLSTDESFLKIFTVRFLKGNPELFKQPHQVLITSELATKFYGKKDPVGQKIDINNTSLTIAGVVEPAGPQSAFEYDIIINRQDQLVFNFYSGPHGFGLLYTAVVVLDEKADVGRIQSDITGLLKDYDLQKGSKIILKPIKDVYFDSEIKDDGMNHANNKLISMLFYVTLAIFLLAIFNYINLTSARALLRFREVGIMKSLGAEKFTIFRQFLFETYLLCLISILLALGVAFLSKPLFESILEKKININFLYNDAKSIVLFIVFFLVTGFISGVIPAISASRFTPASLIGLKTVKIKGYEIRSIMNVLEFVVSIVLIITFIVIFIQVDYVKNKDLGFDQEQLMRVNLRGMNYSQATVLKDKMLANPSITNASLSVGAPGDVWACESYKKGSIKVDKIYLIFADTSFIKTFGIQLLKGKNISSNENSGWLISESYYKSIGWKGLDNQKIVENKIIGMVGDFHCLDLHQSLTPVCIKPIDKNSNPSILNIRIRAENRDQTLKYIQKTFEDFTNNSYFEYKFYDEWFDSMYKQDEKQAAAIRIFTILAILISCLGLFGLAEFETSRKTKEIGIRRVNGATIPEILFMLNKDFLRPVLFAFFIACPVAYYFMDKWLQSFAFKIELSWWIFVLAGFLVIVVALLTVSWHSWQAATRNPVESLKNE